MILTLRTDKPEAEIGLFDHAGKRAYCIWHAHRQLAETISVRINDLLQEQHQSLDKLTGIVVYEGPGSFTGLRIGVSVANALAYGLGIPVAAATGEDWIKRGRVELRESNGRRYTLPEYGAPVHTTKSKK